MTIPARRLEVKRTGQWEWTGFRNGKEVGRAGLTECWTGRGYGWFYDKGLTKREWVQATNAVGLGLHEALKHFNRIEVVVYDSHEAGHLWAERLGFELETVCKRYMPNGDTGRIYVMFGEPDG